MKSMKIYQSHALFFKKEEIGVGTDRSESPKSWSCFSKKSVLKGMEIGEK
jgi:hypothetical protein